MFPAVDKKTLDKDAFFLASIASMVTGTLFACEAYILTCLTLAMEFEVNRLIAYGFIGLFLAIFAYLLHSHEVKPTEFDDYPNLAWVPNMLMSVVLWLYLSFGFYAFANVAATIIDTSPSNAFQNLFVSLFVGIGYFFAFDYSYPWLCERLANRRENSV